MLALCAKWEVNGTVVGEVIEDRVMRIREGDEVVGEMPVEALVDDCPVYDLEPAAPTTPLYPAPPRTLEATATADVLLGLLGSANLASRRWAFSQYDWLVGSRTVRRPGGLRRRRAGARPRRRPTARAPPSPSPSTATAAASPATRTAAPSRRCSSARPTSPAPAPSRSA